MPSCCSSHCIDARDVFGRRRARRDLRRYRARGPSATTRMLLDALLAEREDARTLLDIGGGVGAISHELLAVGFTDCVQIDASAAYLHASEAEAVRRGNGSRITYRFGDFVDLAPDLAPADVVTLDRVVCCYPDVEALVGASVRKTRHLYGLVFPRERVVTRVALSAGNAWFQLRGRAFRAYLHPLETVERIILREGLRRTSLRMSFLWYVATYARA